jgi:hypothetical protein
MNEVEIRNRVSILINLSKDELEIENPKVDFKKQWYNLKDEFDAFEFMKDVTAIANTTGKDGLIIIGYDEKNRTFYPAKTKDCGLTDSSQIQNLVVKMCSDVFAINTFDIKIEEKELSIIHIPPILNKPIIVRCYKKEIKKGEIKEEEQRIFVRKNTRTHYANKNDIDLMYFEREYLKPEFEYELNFLEYSKSSHNSSTNYKTFPIHNSIDLEFEIENLGRRNLSIKEAKITIYDERANKIDLIGLRLKGFGSEKSWQSIFETIRPGESKLLKIHFEESKSQWNLKEIEITKFIMELTLSNDMRIQKSTNQIKEKNKA